MRLIGLDPGLRLTGWGVIDVEGNRLRHVAHGVIKVTTTGSLAERLNELFGGIIAVVEAQRPVEGDTVQTLLDLIAALEDNDDVQNVYANFEVSDDALAKFAA